MSSVGTGARVYKQEKEKGTIFALGSYTTVYLAELKSIMQSAHLALKAGEGRQIQICSDSKSALLHWYSGMRLLTI